MTALLLRRANVSRLSGQWMDDDFDVFNGDREVGHIYRINAPTEQWWRGVRFMLTGRKSYGTAHTLDEAKAAFHAEYHRWQRGVEVALVTMATDPATGEVDAAAPFMVNAIAWARATIGPSPMSPA